MDLNKLQYLPFGLPHFSLLAVIWFVALVWIEVRAFRLASMWLGLDSTAALIFLLAARRQLFEHPGRAVARASGCFRPGDLVFRHGLRDPDRDELAGHDHSVNVGGAVIPTLLSLYLFVRHQLWLRGIIAIAVVAAVCHWLAQPVPGLGIALPVFVPPLSAAAAALILSWRDAPALAYVAGSMGCLIGADLLNLDEVEGLGAPVASIGGAGTFDGIFMTGIFAVLLASIFSPLDIPDGRFGGRIPRRLP